MPLPVIFLDDGGVMNDNRLRGQQWQQLVGEFFVPRLGGSAAAWAEANRVVIDALFVPTAWQARLRAATDYVTFDNHYQVDWLRGMCASVGVTPPTDAECIELGHRATASITRRVRSAFPGAIEAIRTLHAQGYPLHTASAEPSDALAGYLEAMGVRDCFGHLFGPDLINVLPKAGPDYYTRLLAAAGGAARELAGYLDGMGVRECFDRLYGPDLINSHKAGPEFYTRLLADAGVAPAAAVVVDDNADVLQWAAQTGARTVLVRPAAEAGAYAGPRIDRLADLPALLRGGKLA